MTAKRSRTGAPPRTRGSRALRVSESFREYVLAQLEELGDVVPRSMFGGVGLYQGGIFFGLIARDVLYLKVDDLNRPDYERRHMLPFKPYPHRSGTMQYFAVPVDVLESAFDLGAWARKAVEAAIRVQTAPTRPRSSRGGRQQSQRKKRG